MEADLVRWASRDPPQRLDCFMPLFRPGKISLMPTVLAFAGLLTLGAIAPSQALEIAQVSESAESTGIESTGLESLEIEEKASENEASAETAADSAATTSTATTSTKKTVPPTLERPNEDPLLPGKVNGRELTSQEQDRLRLGLERLNLEANASYAQGDQSAAYRQFFRILSLSQYLPAPEELKNLTYVGRRAWQDSLGEEAQVIAARVRQLEADAGEKVSPAQRQALAEAYESLGAWDYAIAHYETLLAMEQPNGEKSAVSNSNSSATVTSTNSQTSPLIASPLDEATLVNRLARLSLFRLNYLAAARYTEQALSLKRQTETGSSPALSSDSNLSESDSLPTDLETATALPLPSETAPAQTSTELLTQLAYVYEQDERFAEAAAVQQQIFPLYADPLFVSQQPALQVAIAQNQARSGQLVEAIASYQAAYGQAQTLQQFAVSNDALAQLAGLYRNQAQLDDALAVYDVLLQVNDLAYDLYGIADIQASRAEILIEQQQLDQARQAYRQAIYAARLLGYREAELQERLNALP